MKVGRTTKAERTCTCHALRWPCKVGAFIKHNVTPSIEPLLKKVAILYYIYVLKVHVGLGWVTTMKTGPNDDARCIVWAISTCFFKFPY